MEFIPAAHRHRCVLLIACAFSYLFSFFFAGRTRTIQLRSLGHRSPPLKEQRRHITRLQETPWPCKLRGHRDITVCLLSDFARMRHRTITAPVSGMYSTASVPLFLLLKSSLLKKSSYGGNAALVSLSRAICIYRQMVSQGTELRYL